MPQLIALALAGAGLYASYKWLTRGMAKSGGAAEQTGEAQARSATDATSTATPKDLGALDWDEAAGVYRPRKLN